MPLFVSSSSTLHWAMDIKKRVCHRLPFRKILIHCHWHQKVPLSHWFAFSGGEIITWRGASCLRTLVSLNIPFCSCCPINSTEEPSVVSCLTGSWHFLREKLAFIIYFNRTMQLSSFLLIYSLQGMSVKLAHVRIFCRRTPVKVGSNLKAIEISCTKDFAYSEYIKRMLYCWKKKKFAPKRERDRIIKLLDMYYTLKKRKVKMSQSTKDR